mgnify:FL=1
MYGHFHQYLHYNKSLFWIYISGDLASFSGLANDKKNLKVFHSDPFDYHSVVDALKGCSCLFYTFEPPQDHSIYDVCAFFSITF